MGLLAKLFGKARKSRQSAPVSPLERRDAESEPQEESASPKSRGERSETESRAIAEIEAIGGHVIELSSGEVRVRFPGTPLQDEDLQYLKSIANLTVLRFEDTEITDAGLQCVASATRLVKLSLRNFVF